MANLFLSAIVSVLISLIQVSKAIVGYPFQYWIECTKPVENFYQEEIEICDDIKMPGGISFPSAECKDHLNKKYYYKTEFEIPPGHSCELFGNGFSYMADD